VLPNVPADLKPYPAVCLLAIVLSPYEPAREGLQFGLF
jgi:hypothetical protein